MRSIKIALRVAIALAMVVALGIVCMATALAEEEILRGAGGGCSWELNMTTGALVIRGEGDMEVYSALGAPEWRNYRDDIRSVTIEEGVTGIGYSAFSQCGNLTQITLPNTVTSLGEYAFAYCTSLTEIVLPPSLTTMGRYTFYDCVNLQKMTVPSSLKNFYNPISFNCSHDLTIQFLGCETRWIWIAESVPQYVTVTFLEHDFSIFKGISFALFST